MYPTETLEEWADNGTMPENVEELRSRLIGRKIVSAEKGEMNPGEDTYSWNGNHGLILTLDDGTRVQLVDTSDCCAYTELTEFLLNPELVDHAITGVGTTDGYQTWHIFADRGDIMKLKVGWSCGNPFYYGYGFEIRVQSEDGLEIREDD